ncbi:MAG: hypothetical protein HRU72_06155 [Planctomycetia bacterium]|nr:hypothetical protein [Candidatus Brocadia sp.]QOJ06162.1 MAG: hypothetical protein HRU72_06155 [Planctomycetia bacterium]TVL96277.1 MAG: hypothetical protein CV082_07260 [Candidatus Brocadia sp. BL1]HQU30536.1 hypothetical protein [Candidatus Brocadia sapporoensis]
MKKYLIMILLVSFLTSFMGCGGVSKKSQHVQTDYTEVVDQKIREIEKEISNLNATTQNLGNRIEDLSQKTTGLDTNYSKIQNALNGLSSKVELKDNAFETILSEAQKNISDLQKKLAEIEKGKTDLQSQLQSLETQKSHLVSSKIEQQAETKKEETKGMVEQGHEMAKEVTGGKKSEEDKKIETIASDHEKEALQKLLDEALILYRDGRYNEAVGKWEEVLVIEPENLEAKFNIEIAKEKIKSLSEK